MKEPQRIGFLRTSPERRSRDVNEKAPTSRMDDPEALSSRGNPRGASLEDSYRHVMQLHMKDELTFQRKDTPGRALHACLPTPDEYTSNMYKLSQLEPIYHDLEEESLNSTPALFSPPPSRPRDSKRSLDLVRVSKDHDQPLARSCWPGGSGGVEAAASFRRKAYLSLKTPMRSRRQDVAPVLFGDPGDSSSVMTGMSQQELLRKKARSESRAKKRGKENDRGSAKKAKDRIINMPAALFFGVSKRNRSTPEKGNKDQSPVARIGSKVEDLILRSSSKSPEANGPLCSQSSEDLDISTAGSTDNVSATTPPQCGQPTGWDRKEKRSTAAKKVAGYGISPTYSQLPTQRDSTNCQDNAIDSRNVRFSGRESLTHIFNDASDRPFDEQDDLPAPFIASRDEIRAAVNPSPPSSGRSLQSSTSGSSGLKSCLRPARFSPLKGSPDRSNRSDEAESLVSNNSISKSPPRGGPGFADHGVELSPIGRAGAVTFNEVVEKMDSFYPDPSLDGASTYSDPTLDMTSEYNTDDDSMISSVNFINNVGAIVIQTAFRRYLAKLLAAKLRKNKIASRIEADQQIMSSLSPMHPQALRQDACDSTTRGLGTASSSTAGSPYSPKGIRAREDRFETLEGRMLTLAATKIQAAFRGFWVRDCLSVDHYCAKVIQQAFRSFICRMEYQFDLYRIVMAQAVWRRQIARLRAAHLLGCAVLIQAAVRMFLQRKAFVQRAKKRPVKIMIQHRHDPVRSMKFDCRGSQRTNACTKEDVAATKLQAMWRRAYAETEFLKTLLDVLLVQTAVRRWFAIRKVKHMKSIKQRLKRRHRYAVAATKRRSAARTPAKPTPPPPLPGLELPSQLVTATPAPSLSSSKPAIITPKGFKSSQYRSALSGDCSGSITGSTSGCSEDESQHVAASTSFVKTVGSSSSHAPGRLSYGVKPPLPSSMPKEAALVTPNGFTQSRYWRAGDRGGTSPGHASDMTDDDSRKNASSPPPQALQGSSFVVEEGSPGGARALLSLWRERDKKNSLAIGR